MMTFALKTPRFHYPEAYIQTGYYPKMDPSEPDQIGWRIYGRGELIGVPTVNLSESGQFPDIGCVFVKITPEFDAWLETLEAAGFVEQTGRIAPAGHVERYAAECRVLKPELMKL